MTTPTPDITVIIASRNRAESLRETLETVANQQTNGAFTYEVVVVDNGSTDHTREVIKALRPSYPVFLRTSASPRLTVSRRCNSCRTRSTHGRCLRTAPSHLAVKRITRPCHHRGTTVSK